MKKTETFEQFQHTGTELAFFLPNVKTNKDDFSKDFPFEIFSNFTVNKLCEMFEDKEITLDILSRLSCANFIAINEINEPFNESGEPSEDFMFKVYIPMIKLCFNDTVTDLIKSDHARTSFIKGLSSCPDMIRHNILNRNITAESVLCEFLEVIQRNEKNR